MEDFDKLWDYNDPVATEINFRELFEKSVTVQPLSYQLQLLTQIARTYSLRRMYNEAYILLTETKAKLPAEPTVATVRYHLELGRTLLSENRKPESKVEFAQAAAIAKQLKEDFFLVDALHMLAIISTGAESLRLNEEAISVAINSTDEAAKNWLGALYNNIGWTFFDIQDYEKSLSVFLRALQWREEKKSAPEIFLAKWCVARVLRAMQRYDDAIKIQLALFEESVETGQPDGYVNEELGELFLLKNDKLKSSFHFEKAYMLLSMDVYLQNNEIDRLERMAELSKQ